MMLFHLRYPYLHIEVAVPSKSVLPSPHLRVMEVNDAFGLNITWEVEKAELRKNFFSCSLIEVRTFLAGSQLYDPIALHWSLNWL